ncbi:hypothetical protein PspR76_31230 [Pseudomonas sp. R76]|nr:hypothetical protein PspR76_31230 [Pseudomonas sp. R76]
MTNSTPLTTTMTYIKWALLIVAAASSAVALYLHFHGGPLFALAYCLVWGSLCLIVAGLIFKSDKSQAAIATASIALVLIGFWQFPPWALI